MSDEPAGDGTPTRRQYLRYSALVAGGGVLAGCSGGGSDNESNASGGAGTGSTGNGTAASTAAGGDATSGGGNSTASGEESTDGSYSVSISPVGAVAFDAVPTNVMVYSLNVADALVAYGHGDAVNSLGFSADTGGKTLDAYYARLDGVSFDTKGLTQLNTGGSGGISVDKETFYELDSDLHLVDPALVVSFDGWSQSDIEEIRTNIAPWFGNEYSRDDTQPPKPYRNGYQYYTLWEIAEKLSKVFEQHDRFRKLAAVHGDLLDRIHSKLPPKNQRPTVGEVIYTDGSFYPSKIDTAGFGNAHVRPLHATDAFTASDVSYQTTYDLEKMLQVDPDVVLHEYGISSYYDVADVRKELQNDSVGSQLSAVQNDRFYASGDPVQGPLMNLFQLEMTAKQLYPEQFGEWPGYTDGDPYPEIQRGERLFDRSRVAGIVAGN